MLYKKYHRNFVKQFKKGTRFECNGECDDRYRDYLKNTVEEEPKPFHEGGVYIIGDAYIWVLVFSDGRLIKDINVV